MPNSARGFNNGEEVDMFLKYPDCKNSESMVNIGNIDGEHANSAQ